MEWHGVAWMIWFSVYKKAYWPSYTIQVHGTNIVTTNITTITINTNVITSKKLSPISHLPPNMPPSSPLYPRDPFKPYAALYAHPAGPSDARPTAQQIIADTTDTGSPNPWAGRVILITGGTAGIGLETVRALHRTGADIFFTARDLNKASTIKALLLREDDGKGPPRGKVEVIEMNLDSLASVRAAAQEFLTRSPRLNVLINNAGVLSYPYTKTGDGFERHWGVNHLAHYLFTRLLLPVMEESSKETGGAFCSRVVNVSSAGHRQMSVRLEDYNFDGNDGGMEKRRGDDDNHVHLSPAYSTWTAYAQSKTANIWTANYIDRVYGPRGVHAMSVQPGGIVTDLPAALPAELTSGMSEDEQLRLHSMSVEQGAATTVWAAVGDVWEGKGGKYLANCAVAEMVPWEEDKFALSASAAAHTYDAEGEERLWELSARLVGLEG
ncbi:hypothetical protein E4U56_007193 [Claviceps arundinis]|uniref:Uncharacterized protein n=1 Tax=Claviceps arundinis TaxID=1623583 RepID=A0A9P7SS04_9HYPO|nr:hypothetical protein E4U56_007193 [Claviceps arundinis]